MWEGIPPKRLSPQSVEEEISAFLSGQGDTVGTPSVLDSLKSTPIVGELSNSKGGEGRGIGALSVVFLV